MSKIEVNEIVNQSGDNDSGIDLTTNDQIGVKIANASKWTLNSSGNLFPASTSQGIVLGATSDTAANRLDDYEEGTWTPAISGLSLTISGATYTKIGNMVRLNCTMQMPATSSSSTMAFTGAPFADVGSNEGAGMIAWSDAPYADGIMIQLQSSTIYFAKNHSAAVAGAMYPQSNFTSNYIRFAVIYTTAS